MIYFQKNPTPGSPPPLLSFLISESKVEVNHTDDQDRTALHLAVMKNKYLYAALLIESGAKLEVSDVYRIFLFRKCSILLRN
jgi:ankyrin repeat protein